MELLMNPEILGFNVCIFSIFYITATSLVGFLGAGQLYLVVKHKLSHVFLGFVLIFSVALLLALVLTPLPAVWGTLPSSTGDLGENIRIISNGYPMSVRIYAIILASVGGVILLVGSLYSFIRDRGRYYVLFFTLGAIFPLLRNVPFGYLGNELAGVISLLIGYLLSIFYIKRQNNKITD
jgi:hypothetical protein